MSDDPTLFGDSYPRTLPAPAWYKPGESLRHNCNVAAGLHPTGFPLHADASLRCRDCANVSKHYSPVGRTFHKCRLERMTAGPGTDIRLRWRACAKLETKAKA